MTEVSRRHPRRARRGPGPARVHRPGPARRGVPDRRSRHRAPTCARASRASCWSAPRARCAGYLGKPEATAATIDADGWVHTGDIVTADDDGWFYVTDRVKELIKYKGFQVAPAELEAILVTHPAVADAAVVRSPDALAGEVPKAFVVLRAPAIGAGADGWMAERVASYKRVRQVEFTDRIPKSPSGKILRRLLTP